MSSSFTYVVIIAIVAVACFIGGIVFCASLDQDDMGFVNVPAFDSGWVSPNINDETVIAHGLGTTEVLVFITGKDTDLNTVHQFRYGGDCTMAPHYRGVAWYNMNSTHISLWTYRDEDRWDYVRVQMWYIQE